jgi:hypothetical protein
MQFQDDLAAGIVLVRPALRSPNYQAGIQGWNVGIDGDAEFNNVVVRGTVVARNAAGASATLTPNAPSGIAAAAAPGLQLSMPSGDVTPASLTEFDDEFTRGLYLRTSSPVDIESGTEGVDFASIRMEGRFHGSDPVIALTAGSVPDAPDGGVWINGTFFDALGGIQTYGGPWVSYTPGISGTGGATISNRVGYYRMWGDECEFVAYFVFSGAGSGAANLAITGPPFDIDRSTRQFVPAHLGSMVTMAKSGAGTCLAQVSGVGNEWDRLRSPADVTLVGGDITGSTVITIQGRYRTA